METPLLAFSGQEQHPGREASDSSDGGHDPFDVCFSTLLGADDMPRRLADGRLTGQGGTALC